jgi:hypothetical protein
MKKLYILLAVLLITASTFAQAPEKMSYQAVVRDSGDNLVTSQPVGMRISILKGAASGIAVYEETQTQTTNVNGLVTLEIGGGTLVDGDFTTIDWSADTYFIKTETDPTGGTTYTITGVSQLLSVPYALHAKTAGSATETQTLADVASLGNSLNTQLKDVTDPTDAQDAATKAYVDVLEARLTALATRITALEPVPAIGDAYQGGLLAYILQAGDPGYVSGETHGLIAAVNDQTDVNVGIAWITGGSTQTTENGNTLEGLGTGQANTTAMMNQTGYTGGAAKLCDDYSTIDGGVTYNDWFLPSKDELNLMYTNSVAIGGFDLSANAPAFSYYLSSTEYTSNYVWTQSFYNGNLGHIFKYITYNVRAVRAF